MAVEPGEFLSAAVAISGTLGGEIGKRIAIGRAYYACYLFARDCADSVGCPDLDPKFVKGGVHELLAERYACHDARESKALAYILRDMKTARHCADYDIAADLAVSSAQSRLAQANKFFEKLSSFAGIENPIRQADAGHTAQG